jgi:hypothetical protein
MDHMDSNQAVDKKHSHCSPEEEHTQAETDDSPDTEDTVDIPDKPDYQPSAVHIPEMMPAVREMEPEMAHTPALVPAAVAREMFQEKVVDIPVVVPGNLERLDRVHSRAETTEPLTDEKATRPSHARDAQIADRQD